MSTGYSVILISGGALRIENETASWCRVVLLSGSAYRVERVA